MITLWRHCPPCDVKWQGGAVCWCCGGRGVQAQAGPSITSQRSPGDLVGLSGAGARLDWSTD